MLRFAKELGISVLLAIVTVIFIFLMVNAAIGYFELPVRLLNVKDDLFTLLYFFGFATAFYILLDIILTNSGLDFVRKLKTRFHSFKSGS